MRLERWLFIFLLRLRSVFRRRRVERELDDELRYHIERKTEEFIAQGMTPEEARYTALREFAGFEQAKEKCRDTRRVSLIETLLHDIRFGARMLRKSPGFTAVTILTLALGIGANTAIFSVVNAVLLRPLPFPRAGRLVMVWATNVTGGLMEDVASYPDFEDWSAQSVSFERLAAFTTRSATLSNADRAELVSAVQATPGFFEALGVHPAMGRTFRNDEQEPGTSRVVILSDLFWRLRFAGRADVVGQRVRLNEETYTIIAVMPSGFEIPPGRREQIYLPLVRDTNRNHGFLMVLGRLRPHVSLSRAQAEMDIVTQRLAELYPKSNRGVGVNIEPLVDALVGKVRAGLLLFLGVVGLVLLIACSNVANLMLARSAARQKELAVRAALGASRKRLLQQLLTESILLGLGGGALGLMLASWIASLLAAALAKNFSIPRIENTHTDAWVLGFTLLVSLGTGILFGVAPALGSASPDLNEGLRESGRTTTGGTRGRRIRSALVVTETALAVVLLAGAGLLLRSLLVMRKTAPGFQTENLLAVNFWLPRIKFADNSARFGFFERVLERVGSLPGVRSAALVADLPLGGGEDSLGFHIIGRSDPGPGKEFSANFNIVSPSYFRTMGIPVRAGREFTERDAANTPGVIVINETAARRFWPGEDPLGKQITFSGITNLTVVGVTGDVRQSGLGSASRPEIFLDYLQPGPPWPWLVLVVRTTSEPMTLANVVKGAAQSVDRDVPISQMRTMNDVLSDSLAAPNVYTFLLGVFALLALALATVGLYGVVSHTVTQRKHEMGIRLALGAGRGDILRLVLRHGMSLSVSGAAIGLPCALGMTRLLTRVMPDVQHSDPLTLLCVSMLLVGVALAACYIPARRAMRVDPMVALRYE